MGLTVIDNILKFAAENANAMDRALNRMAVDIERLAKAQVPLKTGQLRASGHFTKKGFMKYEVDFNKVYARFQEFGGDSSRTVRHYTYPGRKAHYLRDAGREIAKKAFDYLRQEANTVKV